MYEIRDKNGILIAKIDSFSARKIFSGDIGYWREYRGKKRESCYEISDDFKFGLWGFQLFLWKGTIIKEEQ